MTMTMKLKLKNRSKRYGISRPRPIHLIPKKHSLFVRKGISFYQNSLFVIEPFFVAFLKYSFLAFLFVEVHLYLVFFES